MLENLALVERLEALLSHFGQPAKQAEQREVNSLLTWVSCFVTYIAIVSQAHPDCTGDILTYLNMIVCEALKYGGTGWLTYNTVFKSHQHHLTGPWNMLNPSLHTAYITAQGTTIWLPCRFYSKCDHPADSCTLAPSTTLVRPQWDRDLPQYPSICPAKRPSQATLAPT